VSELLQALTPLFYKYANKIVLESSGKEKGVLLSQTLKNRCAKILPQSLKICLNSQQLVFKPTPSLDKSD